MGCLNSAHVSSTTLLKLAAGHDKSAHFSQDHQANLGDAISCQDKCSIRYASRSSIPNGSHIGASTLRVFSQRRTTSYLDSTQNVTGDLYRIVSQQVFATIHYVDSGPGRKNNLVDDLPADDRGLALWRGCVRHHATRGLQWHD
jgi:hypothetical protein